MINRNKKIIANILTVCAIMGLIPTMCSQRAYASENKALKEKEGVVNKAIPYADGKLVIDGEITKDSDNGIFYYNGTSFKNLEDNDIESGDSVDIYGNKYVNIANGDYFIDLSNGKITDDELTEDNMRDTATALKKKFKKVDRYNNADVLPTLTKVKSNDFSELFYEYNENGFTGYTDAKGNYIDADYNVGKVNVVIGSTHKKFTNTKDTETIGNKKYKLFVSETSTLGQDKDNVYRLAKLEVKEFDAKTSTWVTPTEKVVLNSNDEKVKTTTGGSVTVGKTNEMTVIQKISKTQAGGTIDEANYAKVDTYSLADEDNKQLSLMDSTKVSFVKDKIISWKTDGGKVTVQTLDLQTKHGNTYFKENISEKEGFTALDIDVNGNLWRLNKGKIYEFDNNKDWKTLYKTDGSMDELSVYDSNNLITWNKDTEIYATAKGVAEDNKDKDDANKDNVNKPEEKVQGWVKDNTGLWSFINDKGVKATGWVNDKGAWYFLDEAGVMKTGWINDKGNWYYLDTNGAMKTGWINDKGTWYFAGDSGAMQTGWVNDNGVWYFLNTNGAMAYNTTINGYNLSSNGAWIK